MYQLEPDLSTCRLMLYRIMTCRIYADAVESVFDLFYLFHWL